MVTPDAGEQFTSTEPETASDAVGSVYVTAAPESDVASAVNGPGMPENTGSVVSRTVTVKLPDELLFELSVAVHETVVVPIG